MNGVDVAHGGEIAEDNFIWANPYDRAVYFEKLLDPLTLTKSDNMSKKKNIRGGIVPRTRYRRERRQKKVVYAFDEKISQGGCERDPGDMRARWQGDPGEHGNQDWARNKLQASKIDIGRRWAAG